MLESPLTGRAQEDLAWLQKRLGARLRAPERATCCVKGEDVESWVVAIAPAATGGKWQWFYGEALEDVYARIRRDAEASIASKRRKSANA